MIIDPVFREYVRLRSRQNKGSLSNWKILSLKTSLFLLSTVAILAPGMSVKAEIIMGIIETYNPQSRQATISLGQQDGIGKYDRGKIELTSLDSPNVRFVGANIVVVSVEKNYAVVSVREAPGVPVPIQTGARVTVDTESGIARREEEAKIIAAQQAEAARRQQQLEEARAEQARRQRELEQARATEARRQRELEEARAAEARRQQQLEAQQAEAARRQRELEATRVEEARRQQQNETARQPEAPSQVEPGQQSVDLDEAKDLWQDGSATDSQASTADLPLDYLQAYSNAREQPSPETYYRFAEVLINYEISEQALAWLEETRSRFPSTTTVNDLYRAVVLIQQGKIDAGQKILETAALPDNQLADEFRSYASTQQGEWSEVLALSKPQKSATVYNNHLIALYCTESFDFERETDLSPKACPFGSVVPEPVKDDDEQDDDEKERATVESNRNRENLRKISEKALAAYPEDPYILNTLGFIALQSEDYEVAYERFQQLANLLDQYDSTPPRLQLVKANAIKYVNNYNQNYEFLADNGEDLDSLRSRQNSLSDAILIGGAGSAITSALTNDVSPVGLIGGVLATFLRFNQSQSREKDISKERNSIADQMHQTFTKDIDLVATPPDLDANSLLKLTSRETKSDSNAAEPNYERIELNSDGIDDKLRQFDEFWEKN